MNAKLYATRIKRRTMTIQQVPAELQEAVLALLPESDRTRCLKALGRYEAPAKMTKAELLDMAHEIFDDEETTAQIVFDFTGMSAQEVVRSLSYRPALDELRQACDWLRIPWDNTMTRKQLRELIDAKAAEEA